MTITPISGLVSGNSAPIAPQPAYTASTPATASSQTSANVQDVLSTQDISLLPGALKQATDAISQSISTTQVASQALQKQTDLVAQLQQLAAQATTGSLSDSSRQELNIQFQQLVSQLNSIAGTTQFTGHNLLDGTFSQTVSTGGTGIPTPSTGGAAPKTTLQIPDLSAHSLFGDTQPNLTSQNNAQQAVQILGNAAQTLAGTQQDVGAFTQTLTYVAAGLESALYNQNAATSTFSETDFSGSGGLTGSLRSNASSAAAASGTIPASVLDLIG